MSKPKEKIYPNRTSTTIKLQPPHFAFIASIISSIDEPSIRYGIAVHFKRRLTRTNPKFDGRHFLAACTVTRESPDV